MAIAGNSLGAIRTPIGMSGPPFASVCASLKCSGTTGHTIAFSIDPLCGCLQVVVPVVSACTFRVRQATKGVAASYVDLPDLNGVNLYSAYTGGRQHTYYPAYGATCLIEATANAVIDVQARA
jgi:hypothetical protein